MTEPIMKLGKALSILAEVHTATDHQVGFVVQMGARPEPWHFSGQGDDYIEAWRSVRYNIGLQITPEDGGAQ